jgi:heptosyltransferase-2
MRPAIEESIKLLLKKAYLETRGLALKALRPFIDLSIPLTEPIRRILFIRVDRVGDMALSTSAFRAIKAAWSPVHLTVMASPANAPVLKNNADVDEVIVYERTAPLAEKIRFFRRLRARRFDLAVDPHDGYELKTAWLAWMSGAAHRIGYAAFGREIFLNHTGPKVDGERHFVDRTLDLLKGIDIPCENRSPIIFMDEEERAWGRRWLQERELAGRQLVAIHPGAHYQTQRWLPEYYRELILLVRRETPREVILLAGPAEESLVETITGRIRQKIPVFIEADLRKFLALLSQCQMLICNNSGPLHCATALGIPTISFMGPTVKAQWMPIGERHLVLRKDDLPCIGCNLGTCKIKTHDCMRLISPRTVMDLMLARAANHST